MKKLEDNLSKSAVENIKIWLNNPKYAIYKDEIERMISDEQWDELEDAFFKVIEFGTAGRRGMTGVGSNRINLVTIGESAQALCSYIKKIDSQAPSKGIAIAYDTRLSSPELSQYTARVCSANGFKTYLFDSFRSTPELSFTVRHLGCVAGIVISASHNPPTDNGLKIYWSDGGQVLAPHDSGILEMANASSEILVEPDFDQAVRAGKITMIGEEVDEAYYEAVVSQSEGEARDLAIVYSPLHGTGQVSVLPVLKKAGFDDIVTIEEQMEPDGSFPTISSGKPNPSEPSANKMSVEYMLENDADIAITNDPDADRVGLIVNHHGKAIPLNGNQLVMLATDYSLSKLKQKGELTPLHYMIKTIVTTDALNALADKYGVKIYDNLLVGFKYIGELINSKENTDEVFVIAGEESYGMLKGDYIREKDGASGALLLAEYSAELKQSNKTLVDRLWEIYAENGLFVEIPDDVVYPGAKGFVTMQNIMKKLRSQPPTKVGDELVTAVLDYQTLERRTVDGETQPIDCIKGNVLVFEFGDRRRRITIRPSGTEPKIKIYLQWYQKSDDPEKDQPIVSRKLEKLLEAFSQEVL